MKKIAATITMAISFAFVFAISDKEKNAMSGIVQNPLGTQDEIKIKIKDNASTIKVFADWALANPQEAGRYIRADKNRARYLWLLDAYLSENDKNNLTTEQDFAIFGGKSASDRAFNSKSDFEDLKKVNFTKFNVKMDDNRILLLAIRHGDIALAETYSPEMIVPLFGAYLTAVEKSLENATPQEAWAKYVKIVQKFMPYQEKEQVKSHWVRLLSDQDSMAMIVKQQGTAMP